MKPVFDAVHTGDASDQAVVIAMRGAVEGEVAAGEIVIILREAVLYGDREDRHVACGGDLFAIGQTMCVAEGGALHPQRPRRTGHLTGEGVDTAAEVFRDRGGDVIGRPGSSAQGWHSPP